MSFNLEAILKLGEIDTKLIEARRRLARADEQAAPQRERVALSKAELASLVDQLKLSNRKTTKLEGEAEAKRAAINKSEVALNSAKSNEEYQAHLRSIDGHKQELSDIETQILESYDEQEENTKAQKAGTERLANLEKDLKAAAARVKAYEEELQTEISGLEAQRGEASSCLGSDFLDLYEKLLARVGDSAIARVVDEMCQGCYTKVRPNQVSQIRGRKELVTCWTCGRVLYGESSA